MSHCVVGHVPSKTPPVPEEFLVDLEVEQTVYEQLLNIWKTDGFGQWQIMILKRITLNH